MRCERKDCPNDAVGYVAVKLYPSRAVQKFHQAEGKPMSIFVLGLQVCDQHPLRLEDYVLKDGGLDAVYKMVEGMYHIAVDRTLTEVILLPESAKEVQALLASRRMHRK